MLELLEALGKNPSAQRRKWLTITAIPMLPIALAFGIGKTIASREPPCSGGPAKLEGIWELQGPGEPETLRKVQIRRAFLQTGKGYALDVFATVTKSLTSYATSWANLHREACEATEIRREQSAEVLDLRMSCLQERLGGLRALTNVFVEANGQVVENAVSAANALGSLDRCSDVPLLRAVVRPPEDAGTRARVANLRNRVADLKARFDAGRWKQTLEQAPSLVSEARSLGYQPLLAEALSLAGVMYEKANDAEAAQAALSEAFLAADASRHDEVRAEAATSLVFVVGYQRGQFDEAQRWARIAHAVLERLGGHQLLQAWLSNDLGCVYDLHGDKEEALKAIERGLALKQEALGSEHPDVGASEGNVGLSLQGLNRNAEALAHLDRSIRLLEKGLGAGHPDLATQLSNRGEILTALGRYGEARESFDRARGIWERELGADNLNLGFALTGIGVSYLAEGAPTNAIAPLERAFRIREAQETEQSRRADTGFALARALWDARRSLPRARMLAEQARTRYEASGAKAKLIEVDGWLRTRGGGSSTENRSPQVP
jgi:tetratricopeptide (TPR) repeat protein